MREKKIKTLVSWFVEKLKKPRSMCVQYHDHHHHITRKKTLSDVISLTRSLFSKAAIIKHKHFIQNLCRCGKHMCWLWL